MRLRYFILLPALCVLLTELHAQEDDPWKFRLSANAGLSSEIYSIDSDSAGAVRARRPGTLSRLILNASLNSRYISLPFTIVLSNNQTNYTTPKAGDQSFWQYLQNPMNTLRFSPRFGRAQFHLGSYIPDYSELSTGNAHVFGGGFDLRPGDFQIRAFYGSSQRAIGPDSVKNIRGAYGREFFAAKLGHGELDSGSIAFNFVMVKDDTNSVESRPAGLFPEEGMLTSFEFSIPLIKDMLFTGELGVSIFTRNLYSDEADYGELDFMNSFYDPKESTILDGAATASLLIKKKLWGFEAKVLYMGDGYRPLGYNYLQSDRIEYTISPRARLLDNKLNLNATVGIRTNNLSDTKAQTTNNLLVALNASYLIMNNLNLNASFMNYGVRNNTENDTLKIETVSRSISVGPSYTMQTNWAVNTIMANISFDNYNDFNTISGVTGGNLTQAYMTGVISNLTKTPLSLNLSINYMTNDVPDAALETMALNIGGSYRMFNGKLVPSLRITFSQYATGGNTSDTQFKVSPGIRYGLANSLSLSAEAYYNTYEYGSARQGIAFNENYLRLALNYNF
ncbi:MAG: hypothetical protein ACLFQU_11720 [Candidatus Kapaibacterium sp.]